MNKLTKKIKSFFDLNKQLLIFILTFYVGIGHIVLPAFNKSNFFFFAKWGFFSSMPKKFVYDLTFDKGKSFVMRDHVEELKEWNINKKLLESLLGKGLKRIKRIRRDYKDQLLLFCDCKFIQHVKLKGSYADHFLYKKTLEIMESVEL